MKYTFDTSKHNDTDYILQWVHDHGPTDIRTDSSDYWTTVAESFISDGTYRTLAVAEQGGYEQGPDRRITFAICKELDLTTWFYQSAIVKDAVCYFQVKGYYNSYEGTEWEKKVKIVTPEITTTVLFK